MNILVFGRSFLFSVLILGLISCGKNPTGNTQQEDDWAPRPPQIVRKKSSPSSDISMVSTEDEISFVDPESQRGLQTINFEYSCPSANGTLVASSVSLFAAQSYKVLSTMSLSLLPLGSLVKENEKNQRQCDLKIVMFNKIGSTRTFKMENLNVVFDKPESEITLKFNGNPIQENHILHLRDLYAVEINLPNEREYNPTLVCEHFMASSKPDQNGAFILGSFLSDSAIFPDNFGRNHSRDTHTQFCKLAHHNKNGRESLSKQFAIRFYEPEFVANFTTPIASYLKGSTLSSPEILRTEYYNSSNKVETIRIPLNQMTGRIAMYSENKFGLSDLRAITFKHYVKANLEWDKDGYRYIQLPPHQNLSITYRFEGAMACFAPGLVHALGVTIDNAAHLKIEKALYPIERDQESSFIPIPISSAGNFNGKSTNHTIYSDFYVDLTPGYIPPSNLERPPSCWIN